VGGVIGAGIGFDRFNQQKLDDLLMYMPNSDMNEFKRPTIYNSGLAMLCLMEMESKSNGGDNSNNLITIKKEFDVNEFVNDIDYSNCKNNLNKVIINNFI